MLRSEQIRILHVVGGMNCGGAETLIMNIYRHIDRSKVQFDFAVQTQKACHYDDEIRMLGGRIFPHPNPSIVGFRAYSRALADILREHGYFSGIHSHVYNFSGYVLRVARKVGVPLRLAHSHNIRDGKEDSLARKFYRWYMRRLILQNATHLLSCSCAAGEALFGSNCWRDPRIMVVPNAINLTPFKALSIDRQALREKLSLPVNVPLIGHVGRFEPQKNHYFLIEIFSELLKKVPQTQLILVGDGPLRPEIDALIKMRGISANVQMLGIRSDIPEIMGALDLFLFPSLYEGLGIVLIEAQAAGVPCVIADTIPAEVDLNVELIEYVSLQAGKELWIEQILKGLDKQQTDWQKRQSALQDSGYDIQDVARWLERIYLGGVTG